MKKKRKIKEKTRIRFNLIFSLSCDCCLLRARVRLYARSFMRYFFIIFVCYVRPRFLFRSVHFFPFGSSLLSVGKFAFASLINIQYEKDSLSTITDAFSPFRSTLSFSLSSAPSPRLPISPSLCLTFVLLFSNFIYFTSFLLFGVLSSDPLRPGRLLRVRVCVSFSHKCTLLSVWCLMSFMYSFVFSVHHGHHIAKRRRLLRESKLLFSSSFFSATRIWHSFCALCHLSPQYLINKLWHANQTHFELDGIFVSSVAFKRSAMLSKAHNAIATPVPCTHHRAVDWKQIPNFDYGKMYALCEVVRDKNCLNTLSFFFSLRL